jgi:hypothetical protein
MLLADAISPVSEDLVMRLLPTRAFATLIGPR